MIKGTVVQQSRDGRQVFVALQAPLEIVPIPQRYDEDAAPIVVTAVCASREINGTGVAVFPAAKRGNSKKSGYVIIAWNELGSGCSHEAALADSGVEI